VVFFIINLLASMSGGYDWLQYLTMFSFFDPETIIAGGQLPVVKYLVLLAIAAGLYVSGVLVFRRKYMAL